MMTTLASHYLVGATLMSIYLHLWTLGAASAVWLLVSIL